ncbi:MULTISPECIES: YqcC family protein [unclassified Marinobacterium]|jgi:uncharacterized protein YqcC (DUF446 family)|uniref:YqcC family protein n=1 Tax=unclassified Marinobacterium TaxID=2644139 RepID=UPI0015689F94|nr:MULTISPECIES: YqcC family protein [unclassified Marinobacterium]NRP58255.1 hypothetical protein [Marinobacterium sp. xm-d-510]NRP97393.1 hypothetical protein [Marinobacterium sp. xm-a-127]
MSKAQAVTRSIEAIRDEMVRLSLWEASPPTQEALNSQQPFCIDTLKFTQWLQWILIPRLEALLKTNIPLPDSSAIHPYAEEALKSRKENTHLIAQIQQLDRALSGDSNG